MAAPVFVSGSVNSGAITTGTSVTVSSTGTTPVFGNLQVVFLAVGGASRPTAFTPPAGWNTLLATTATASSSPLISVAVFWRTAPATAAFSGSFSWTTTATSGEWLFCEWSGQGPLAIDGAVVTSVNATSTSPTSPTITPANGRINDTLVVALAAGATGATTISVPAGMTSSVLAHAGTAGTQLFGCAALALASASATGTKTWTLGTTTLTFGISFLIQQAGPFVQRYSSDVVSQRQLLGAPRSIDFAFPNNALLHTPVLTLLPRAPLFTYQLLPVRNLDFAFPNFVVQSPPGRPVGSQQLDQSPRKFWPTDYQFPNVALQAFAQLAVKPVGAIIDESVPFVQPRQLDFQFPTVATRLAPPMRPIGSQLLDQAPLKYQPIDWQFPNVALRALAQLSVHPVGAAIDESIPAPVARQLDFAFPNIANPPTTPVVSNVIFRPPLFNRPVATVLPVDAPIPNLLTTTLTTVVVKPLIPQPFSDRPSPAQRVQEFVPPNLSTLAAAQAQVHPVGGAIDETVPLPAPHQLDFAFANIVLPNSAAPTLPVGKALDETVPRVDPRQLDFAFPNLPALNFAQLQVQPVGSAIDESRPAPQPRPIDFQFRSTAQLASKVKPFTNLFFDRPVSTSIPVDGPIPNLLTTTLSVAPGTPFVVPFFLLADRPSPTAAPQDQAPVNFLIFRPPPAVSTLIQRTLVGVGL